jgi:hypothetical protein
MSTATAQGPAVHRGGVTPDWANRRCPEYAAALRATVRDVARDLSERGRGARRELRQRSAQHVRHLCAATRARVD